VCAGRSITLTVVVVRRSAFCALGDTARKNAHIFDFITLPDADMAHLDSLGETSGIDRALERKWW
jgi:hypothetical protein